MSKFHHSVTTMLQIVADTTDLDIFRFMTTPLLFRVVR